VLCNVSRLPPFLFRRKGKYLTAFERRKLGLNKLPKTGLVYDDFRELHQLWQGYIAELLPGTDFMKPDFGRKKYCRSNNDPFISD
jgi:hypothetical protein